MLRLSPVFLIVFFFHTMPCSASESPATTREKALKTLSESIETPKKNLNELNEIRKDLIDSIKSYVLKARIELMELLRKTMDGTLDAIESGVCSTSEEDKGTGLMWKLCHYFLDKHSDFQNTK